jgi:hypothetical protein
MEYDHAHMRPIAPLLRGPWPATLAVALLIAACGPGGSLPADDAGAGGEGGGARDGQADTAHDGPVQDDAGAQQDAPVQDDAPPQRDAQSDTYPAFGCYGFLINEFQTQGTSDNDEFIEVAGPVGGDLSALRLFYREAAGTTDVSLIAFSTGDVIPASGYVIIASNGWVGGDAGVPAFRSYYTTTGKLSTTGGGLALRRGGADTGTIVDSVGYGNATNAFVQGSPTAAPPAGKSSSRTHCKNTGNNSSDFSWTNPTPGH